MAELVKVVVDAMGGDYAPVEPVKAAVEAVKERDDIQVILTGIEDVVRRELDKYQDYPKDRIQVVSHRGDRDGGASCTFHPKEKRLFHSSRS